MFGEIQAIRLVSVSFRLKGEGTKEQKAQLQKDIISQALIDELYDSADHR